MKYHVSILTACLILLLSMHTVYGVEGDGMIEAVEDALPYEVGRMLEGLDPMEAGSMEACIVDLLHFVRDAVEQEWKSILRCGVILLLIVLLCDTVQLINFQKEASPLLRCGTMTGALAISLYSYGSLTGMIALGTETIQVMNDFSKTLLPVVSSACALSGQVTSAAIRELLTVFFADLLISLISMLLIPLVYIYLGAITANAMLPHAALSHIAAFVKKFITWFLTILCTLFTAFLTVSGVLSGSADAAALRVAKFAISGAVPVVGGIMSNAAGTLLSGAAVLKNTVGVLGVIGVFGICIVPFCQIGMQYLVYKISAFLAELVDQIKLSNLIQEIGGAFGMVLGMVGACALLLMISMIVSIMAMMPL